MKIFQCGHCAHALFFENHSCENCGHLCGYRDADRTMLTFAPDTQPLVSDREAIAYKYCRNHEHAVCNWLIEASSPQTYCSACQLNRTIPDLSFHENFDNWTSLEVAKHRLVYQLQKLGLPLESKLIVEDGLCFDFVEQLGNPKLMTGHASGVITILLREADSVVREQTRREFHEPYRTLIGHLRHEVGHYYWDRLIYTNAEALSAFRQTFGDERADYSEALQAFYKDGAPADWQTRHISKYSTAHPWEDWAETWAHYLHIMDMVETAYFFGISVSPVDAPTAMIANIPFDPYTTPDFQSIIDVCVPLSYSVNSLNRAMGISDVYPFVISPSVRNKLVFIHGVLFPLHDPEKITAS